MPGFLEASLFLWLRNAGCPQFNLMILEMGNQPFQRFMWGCLGRGYRLYTASFDEFSQTLCKFGFYRDYTSHETSTASMHCDSGKKCTKINLRS